MPRTPDVPRFLRQASEQNFTSSQFFAHFFRQVIGRPQTVQGLEGSDCLLPLNGVIADRSNADGRQAVEVGVLGIENARHLLRIAG